MGEARGLPPSWNRTHAGLEIRGPGGQERRIVDPLILIVQFLGAILKIGFKDRVFGGPEIEAKSQAFPFTQFSGFGLVV